jgi:ribonuclease HII
MRRALLELERKINFKKIESISIDWNDNYKFEKLTIEPIFVVRWDEKVLEIWAASIIAKVFRDKLIDSYDILYPDLGIEKHKGYWTKKHEKYLTNKKKITGVHRLTYKPIKKLLWKKSGKKKS